MAYLLDANVFIQASRLHYGLDFCPAFWEWLTLQNQAGIVHSIEKVGDELQAMADDLSNWALALGAKLFLPTDPKMLSALGTVSTWVHGQQQYAPAAVSTFLQVADYYLVAHALAHRHTLVTHEVAAPQAIRKVKIPDVCVGLNVKVMTPYEMLRTERARFVLGK
jgi:hypothetical protein